MKKIIVVAFLFLASTVYANSSFYTDDYGNTTGTVNGQPYHSYTDDYGNTTGTVGNKSFHCYTDSYGNTTCSEY